MTNLAAAFVAVATLLGIAGVIGAVYANFRSTALEASNKRLTADNDYYLKKVSYLEPKVEALERENETLRTLINPAQAIEALRKQEADNHTDTYALLQANNAALQQLHRDLLAQRVSRQEPSP